MVTISDVARRAGVSIGTVSFAFSGKRPVATETRQAILAAAKELGYRPNAGARMLAGRKSDIIALSAPLHPDMHVPAQMKYVSSVVQHARACGWDVLLLAQEDAAAGLERITASSLVDGVVMMAMSLDDPRVEQLRRRPMPAAAIGVPENADGVLSCVDLDFAAAARLAVSELRVRGHRSIGMIGYPQATFDRCVNFAPRFIKGFESECRASGVDYGIRKVEVTRADVAEAVRSLRRELPGLTGIVANCDEPVQGMLLEALRLEGLRIPEDVSVISACSSFSTEFMPVPLSVIPHPAEELGRRAVADVLAQLQGSGERGATLLPPELHDLGSLARARA